MPNTRRDISSAAVAEFKQTDLGVPNCSAIFFSSSLVRGPVVIHPLFKASMTSLISKSVISGGEKLIFIYITSMLSVPY